MQKYIKYNEIILQISSVKKEPKDKLVKLVEPNFIYNRFDVFYDNQYELQIPKDKTGLVDSKNINYLSQKLKMKMLTTMQ